METFCATHRRVEMFCVLLGLAHSEVYTQHVCAAFFRVLRRLVTVEDNLEELKKLNELLDNGEGVYVLDEAAVRDGLIGRAIDGSDYGDPATWTCWALLKLLSKSAIKQLLNDVLALPTVQRKNFRAQTIKSIGYDLDAVLWAVLERLMGAVADHDAQLAATFTRYNGGLGGVNLATFGEMVDWTCGSHVMDEKAKLSFFNKLETATDDVDEDEDGVDELTDAKAFASAVVRSTSPMAYPCNCRDCEWWCARALIGVNLPPSRRMLLCQTRFFHLARRLAGAARPEGGGRRAPRLDVPR